MNTIFHRLFLIRDFITDILLDLKKDEKWKVANNQATGLMGLIEQVRFHRELITLYPSHFTKIFDQVDKVYTMIGLGYTLDLTEVEYLYDLTLAVNGLNFDEIDQGKYSDIEYRESMKICFELLEKYSKRFIEVDYVIGRFRKAKKRFSSMKSIDELTDIIDELVLDLEEIDTIESAYWSEERGYFLDYFIKVAPMKYLY